MDNKKKFQKPELEVVIFTSDDIITTSAFGNPGTEYGDINDPKPNPFGWW